MDVLEPLDADATGTTFKGALDRAKAEYLEMPGLQLTSVQAARLWSLDRALCDAVLAALVEQRFLVRTRASAFIRAA